MTIHSSHPFADPSGERDPARQLRGRLGGTVSLWTAGTGADRAGLTVSSFMVARGEQDSVLALLDPDSDLCETLLETGRGLVHLLRWRHRDLAEMFADLAPAPGGRFRQARFADDEAGPRLVDATTWLRVRVEDSRPVGWSTLVTAAVEAVHVGEEDDLLVHRRGRYARADETPRADQ